MKLLLYAGLLYLIGISIVLVLQPDIMFRDDGVWKEFGIGRSARHTWMPFWLFSILWAVLSYMIMLILASSNVLPGIKTVHDQVTEMTKRQNAGDVRPGYYILNPDASRSNGAPKYIYLGEEIPSMLIRK